MERNSSISHSEPPRRTPLSPRALPLLAAGILLVEVALRFAWPDNFMVRTVRHRMDEIVSLPAPPVQIMGDSVTAGINAPNVGAAANLPPGTVMNYSLPGTSPVFTYYALRRELAAGRKPAWILYAPHPANLETPMIDRFIGRFGTARECAGLLGGGVGMPEWLFGVTCRASIVMRYREELRVAVTERNFGFFTTLYQPAGPVEQSPLPQPAAPAPHAVQEMFPPQLTQPFFLDPVNAAYIERFLSLAEENHIRVAWMTVPVRTFFKEHAMAGKCGMAYESYLDSLAARHGNVILLHRQLEVYPDSYFMDQWHLNPYGAWLFSKEVGEALATVNGIRP